MRRIVHLSDLHFGRDRPELLEPLIAAVRSLSPDLVAISGDLTQRARPQQFRAARAFIDGLGAPTLVVPGNHDVPLHNLVLRLIWPWRHYRRCISSDLEPQFSDDEIIVQCVNTVNTLAHQSGRFTRRALTRVARAFENTRGNRTRIVVAHHPLEHQPGEPKKKMRGALHAADELARLKADVILSGHLHNWGATPFARKQGRNAVLQVQAGTGLSTRLRGEENDFNLLEISDGLIDVTRYAVPEGKTEFTPLAARRFVIRSEGWTSEQSG